MMTLMMSVAMETATVAADSNEVFNDTAEKMCPINFVRLSTGCYFFGNSNIWRTWCEAYLFCHTLNSYSARLVIIESTDEQNVIAAYLRTKHTPAEISTSDKAAAIYWIGLNDQLEEGNFIWHDTGKAPTYTYGEIMNLIIMWYLKIVFICLLLRIYIGMIIVAIKRAKLFVKQYSMCTLTYTYWGINQPNGGGIYSVCILFTTLINGTFVTYLSICIMLYASLYTMF